MGLSLACSKTNTVDEAKVARASPADQQRVLAAEAQVNQAEAKLAKARAATEDAKKWKNVVESEHKAAQEQYSAVSSSAELAESPRQPGVAMPADTRKSAARLQRNAATAKMTYAEDLVTLREREAEAVEAEVAVRKAAVQRTKFEAAERAGTAGNLKRSDFVKAEDGAQDELAAKRRDADGARDIAERSRERWVSARSEAAKANPSEPLSDAPPPEPLIDLAE
jgi:hypothetical protein